MKVVEVLTHMSNYPIPYSVAEVACVAYGIDVEAELTFDLSKSAEFKKAKAQIYFYLASAPNVSQNGTSFSFTKEERELFLSYYSNLMEGKDETSAVDGNFGYKGENF